MKKINFHSGSYVLSVIIFLVIIIHGHLHAQDVDNKQKWDFLIDAYMMFPYMDGEVCFGEPIKLPVEASAGDVLSKLKMGAMLYFETKTTKWAVTSDMVYMNLTQDVSPTTLIHSGTVGAKQFIWEAAGLYSIFPFWEVGVGGRLNNLQASFDIRRNVFPAGTEEATGSSSKTWYDPIIITRLSTDIRDRWLFQLRGDIGGFGLGSDLTWQLQAYAGYRFPRVIQLMAGYRILSTDYRSGEEPTEFSFDVNEFGPVVRLGFRF